ncbi:hypothetical protein GCM10007100_21220 [Roseibacillus persicicus]|uniref:VWFA domain-containing protein n=2 Tax=Roseibacillus persicicus TaxID=454148 RepID=A0A918WKF1_9BACT|nr:hypothetical protein GCM10007100_21220 [Roseibacillus persicicus]
MSLVMNFGQSSFPLRRLWIAAVAAFTFEKAHSQIQVDTEMVILVDAQTYSQSDFNLILEGVAQSFESQNFINAVAAGQYGKIAASVVLFNSNGGETVGVPWMELSSANDLQGFASTVRGMSNPTPWGNASYASAITTGAAQIASSAFAGTVRQLSIIDDGTGFWAVQPANTQTARDTALASSVDVINALVFDVQYQVATVENYYNNNVVSGGPNGTVTAVASPQGGAKPASDTQSILLGISNTLAGPTVTAVPEPSSAALAILALSWGMLRRRR